MRRATFLNSWRCLKWILFQSTLSVRRATYRNKFTNDVGQISIHALREESDSPSYDCAIWQYSISIHALREESDIVVIFNFLPVSKFQSTLSVRRATFDISHNQLWFCHFNPRSPWGERPFSYFFRRLLCWISIHALREESDIINAEQNRGLVHFNPRSPWGERLKTALKHLDIIIISIHALREESDCVLDSLYNNVCRFQSTLSVRRATLFFTGWLYFIWYFNPRSPWGERLN